jgi:hypothetical protein
MCSRNSRDAAERHAGTREQRRSGEVETHGGPKVPVAVLNGNARALLTTMAAGNAVIDKFGSGGPLVVLFAADYPLTIGRVDDFNRPGANVRRKDGSSAQRHR